jgi:hypothetical protein
VRVVLALTLGVLLAAAPVGAALELPSGLRLVLLGVVLRESDDSFAIIEDAHTSRVGFYRVGASVGGVRITRIEADRVVVAAGDTRAVLRLGRPVGVAPEPEPPRPVTARRSTGEGPAAQSSPAAAAAPPPPLYGHPAVVDQTSAPGRRQPPISTGTGAPGEAGGSPASLSSVTADVSFTGLHHDGTQRRGAQFSSAVLRDLLIEVSYQGLRGSRQQRIEIYAPDGALYQRISGPAASLTQTRLPVGGTWITAHGLLGTWTTKIFVDGQAAPAGLGTFRLTP